MLRKELGLHKMTPAQYMQLLGVLHRIHDQIDELRNNINTQRDMYAAEAKARTNQAVVEIAGDPKYANKAGAVNQAQELIANETALKNVQLTLEATFQSVVLAEVAEEVVFELGVREEDFNTQIMDIAIAEYGKKDASKGVDAAQVVMNGREQRAKELGDVNKPADYKSREAWEAQRRGEYDAKQAELAHRDEQFSELRDNLLFKKSEGPSYLQRHSLFAAKTDAASVKNDNTHEQDLRSSFSSGM